MVLLATITTNISVQRDVISLSFCFYPSTNLRKTLKLKYFFLLKMYPLATGLRLMLERTVAFGARASEADLMLVVCQYTNLNWTTQVNAKIIIYWPIPALNFFVHVHYYIFSFQCSKVKALGWLWCFYENCTVIRLWASCKKDPLDLLNAVRFLRDDVLCIPGESNIRSLCSYNAVGRGSLHYVTCPTTSSGSPRHMR